MTIPCFVSHFIHCTKSSHTLYLTVPQGESEYYSTMHLILHFIARSMLRVWAAGYAPRKLEILSLWFHLRGTFYSIWWSITSAPSYTRTSELQECSYSTAGFLQVTSYVLQNYYSYVSAHYYYTSSPVSNRYYFFFLTLLS